jgi:hypothetical protein
MSIAYTGAAGDDMLGRVSEIHFGDAGRMRTRILPSAGEAREILREEELDNLAARFRELRWKDLDVHDGVPYVDRTDGSTWLRSPFHRG